MVSNLLELSNNSKTTVELNGQVFGVFSELMDEQWHIIGQGKIIYSNPRFGKDKVELQADKLLIVVSCNQLSGSAIGEFLEVDGVMVQPLNGAQVARIDGAVQVFIQPGEQAILARLEQKVLIEVI